MNEVLLVAVVALAIALMSIVINLMLVARISVLKSDLELLDKTKLDYLKGQNSTTYSGLLSLKNKTKDALEIMANDLNLHGILLEEASAKFDLLDGRVAKHTEQLDDLGKFAGVTTGELLNLEHKIYKANQTVDGDTSVDIKELENRTKVNNIELFNLSSKLRNLEKKQSVNIMDQNDIVTRMSKLEHRVLGLYRKLEDDNISITLGENRGAIKKKINDNLEKLRYDMNSLDLNLHRKYDELRAFVKYPGNYHDIVPKSVEVTVRTMKGKRRKKVNYDVEKYKRDKHKMEFEETMRKMGDPYK